MRGALDAAPSFTTQPQSLVVFAGSPATFSAIAAGGGLTYQWKLNNVAIPGATSASYTIASATAAHAGSYTLEITNSAGTKTSNPATLTIAPSTAEPGHIINLAIRSQAGTATQTLIVGFAVGGVGTTGTKPVLLRGVGPTLTRFNVTGFLADPKLELYNSTGTKVGENDDWAGSAQIATIGSQVGAFDFLSSTSKDAALYNPGFTTSSNSVWITGNGGSTGVALAEIYDATPAGTYTATTPRLINVSARTQVGVGGDVLIAGFVIGGQTSKTVLIRGVGPTLLSFNVPGALADPKLELFNKDAVKIDENDNWGGSPDLAATFLSVGAFGLPAGSADAVLRVTLLPGNYTAQLSGVGGTTGIGLVEVYEVP